MGNQGPSCNLNLDLPPMIKHRYAFVMLMKKVHLCLNMPTDNVLDEI